MKKTVAIICVAVALIAIGSIVLVIYIPYYKDYSAHKDGLLQASFLNIRYVDNSKNDSDLAFDGSDNYDMYFARFVVRNRLNFPIDFFKWNSFKKGDCEFFSFPQEGENIIEPQNINFYSSYFLFKKGTSRKQVVEFIENCEYSCSYSYRGQKYTEKMNVIGLDDCENWLL